MRAQDRAGEGRPYGDWAHPVQHWGKGEGVTGWSAPNTSQHFIIGQAATTRGHWPQSLILVSVGEGTADVHRQGSTPRNTNRNQPGGTKEFYLSSVSSLYSLERFWPLTHCRLPGPRDGSHYTYINSLILKCKPECPQICSQDTLILF